jgi:phosphoenolpyruvate phosphomutase
LIEQIRRVTSLPILFDAENGEPINKLPSMIHRLEPLGVSAIVIEDRVGPKSNSFATVPRDSLADVGAFVRILECAASARSRETTVIVGRLEGLIFGASPAEVAGRARAIESTGVGALLIHSKSKCPEEVLETADRYRSAGGKMPLIAIPTTYSSVTEPELEAGGFSLVVYANQLLRAALRQMTQVAQSILVEGSTAHVEPALLPIKETISYFSAPTNEVDYFYGVGGRIRKAAIR